MDSFRVRQIFVNNSDTGDDACPCSELQLSPVLVGRSRVIGRAEGGKQRREGEACSAWSQAGPEQAVRHGARIFPALAICEALSGLQP